VQTFFDGGAAPTHELGPSDDAAASDPLQERFPTLAPCVRTRLLAEADATRWPYWSWRAR
jgi:hypothetical protein